MRNIKKIIPFFLFVILFFSCSQKSLIIDSVNAYPYIDGDNYYGLAVYFTTNEKNVSSFQCHLVSPSKDYDWDFQAEKISFESNDYYGNSNIAMPNFIPLEMGDYQLTIYSKNNTQIDKTIAVYYKVAEKQEIISYPFFDSTKNLTFLDSSNAGN